MSKVAIIGLGYVGLPLAVAFGRLKPTIGFDIDEGKIAKYRSGIDPTGELSGDDLAAATSLQFSADPKDLADADYLIVTVPTPIDNANRPDLSPLIQASELVAGHLKDGATVIYESTVYPGCTEDDCIPVLEKVSGKRWRRGFHVAYSPERINPGDVTHTLANVVKVVGADSEETLNRVADLYGEVVKAGIHRTRSIAAAEAAKVIENTQRDLNIALMNELAIIFERMGIDTLEVLEAAGTKWNFLPFRPGLVGGHCIGVDPYYLTHKSEILGYHPEVVLAGRRINDGMGKFVAERTVKAMIAADLAVKGAPVSVLGVTFKENCPDLRNSKVIDVIRELQSYGCEVRVHDPVAAPEDVLEATGLKPQPMSAMHDSAALILAVAHQAYHDFDPADWKKLVQADGVIADIKGLLPRAALSDHCHVWRL